MIEGRKAELKALAELPDEHIDYSDTPPLTEEFWNNPAPSQPRSRALTARYDRRTARVVVGLGNGLQLAFPVRLAEGLANAAPDDLAEIEISPTGLGLHWPKLDADVYVPALLQGVFGSKQWMAKQIDKGK